MNPFRRYIWYGWFLIFWLSSSVSFSQPIYQEAVYVHLDRNYFLTGESIRSTIYCIEKGTGRPSTASKLANIELLSQEGRVIRQAKVKLSRGIGWGILDIPADCGSEEHMIRCYTSWMRNFGPETFCYNTVLIIHPSKSYHPVKDRETPAYKPGPDDPVNMLRIDANGLKQTYAPREPVVFSLKPRIPSGFAPHVRLSLSVTRSGSYCLDSPFNSIIPGFDGMLSDTPADQPEAITYMPDLEGLQLTGKVQQRVDGQPVVNEPVLLSFIDSVPEVYPTHTDLRGHFHFDLNGLTGRKDMIIQTLTADGDVLITIDPDFSQEPIPESAWISLQTENLGELYREMLLSQQLSRAYGAGTTDGQAGPGNRDHSLVPGTWQSHLPFYGHYDHQVIMEDFIKLPVMEEVFRELGRRIYLLREQGTYKVAVLDLMTNRIIGARPYYFLDGVPFFDSQKLLDLDPAQIETIRLKSEKYFVGDLVMDGIVDIRSRKGDAGLIDFPRSAVRQYFQAFSNETERTRVTSFQNDPHIPLSQTTLLFEPLREIAPGNEITVELLAPDVKGTCDIVIRGLADDGRRIEQYLSFNVEQ
jgi:hypothetical protein